MTPRLLAALVLLSAACGDSGGSGPSDSLPSGVTVEVGDDYYRSVANATENPAVDTVTVNGTLTWTWVAAAGTHSVWPSTTPSFTPSEELIGGGEYAITFSQPGTYEYECGVHGTAMTGRIVVR